MILFFFLISFPCKGLYSNFRIIINLLNIYLIEQLTASALQKADGTTMALKVYLGVAIADPADKIDSRGFLEQARNKNVTQY